MNNNLKIACLFGGPGSHNAGMGKELYDLDEDCRRVFKTASDVMGYDMAELCFYGEKEALKQTIYSLPSVLTIDLCAYLLATKQGYTFQALAGFSLGEYAALVAAGVVSIPKTFELVKRLSLASDSVLTDGLYGMAAVNLPPEKCENICLAIKNGYVRVANYNSQNQVTLAGNENGLNTFKMIATECGGKFIPISVDRPFHSQLMKRAADIYQAEIESIEFENPTIPLYMNVTGERVSTADKVKAYLVKHLYSPVLWTQTLENLHMAGIELYIECGLKSVLCRLVKDTLGYVDGRTMFFRAS